MNKCMWISKDKKRAINTDQIIYIDFIESNSLKSERVVIRLVESTSITLTDNDMFEFLEFMGMGRGRGSNG